MSIKSLRGSMNSEGPYCITCEHVCQMAIVRDKCQTCTNGQKNYLQLCPWSQDMDMDYALCITLQALNVTETMQSMCVYPIPAPAIMQWCIQVSTPEQCSSMTPHTPGPSVFLCRASLTQHWGEKVIVHYKHLVQWYQGSPLISNLGPGWGAGGGAPLKSHYKSIFHIPDSPMFQGVKSSMYISAIFKLWDTRVAQAARCQPLTLAWTAFISF